MTLDDALKAKWAKQTECAELRAALGQTIHALNLAANRLEGLGQDATIFREAIADANEARWK